MDLGLLQIVNCYELSLNKFIQRTKKQIKSLRIPGYYLNQLPSDEREIEIYDMNRKLYDSKAFPLANLFIPTAEGSYMDRIIVIKKIENVTHNTFEQTKMSMLSHVKEIKAVFENLLLDFNESPDQVPINFVVWSKAKIENDAFVEKLTEDLHNHLTNDSKSSIFEMRAACVLNKDSIEVRRKILLQPINSCSSPNRLLQALVFKVPSETRFQITRRLFNCAGSKPITLNDIECTLNLFKTYFPRTENCLEMLPDFDRICENLLGKIIDCSLSDEANLYLGEVKDFQQKVISHLKKPRGLLIHGYKEHHLNQVLRQPCNCFFEFDWLLVGNGLFTIFEVGRSKNPSSPISTAMNKLSDEKSLRQKHMMQKIVYFFLRETSKLSDDELKEVVQKSVRLVIVFTNTTKGALQESIDKTKSLKKLKIMKNKQILIMTGENADILNHTISTPVLKLFELDANFQLQVSALSTDDLFSSDVARDLSLSEESGKLIKHISAILSFSYLLNFDNSHPSSDLDLPVKCPLGVDDRLSKEIKNAAPGTSHLDIVLSPQQHRLLDENPKKMFLVGEPGTGKTAVLLAKAFYAAVNEDDVKHVIISFPSEKTEFKELIVNLSESQNIPPEAKKKLKFFTLDQLAHIAEAHMPLNNHVNVLPDSKFSVTDLHKSILLMDELYLESTDTLTEQDQFHMRYLECCYHAKQCWITNLVAGQHTVQKKLSQKTMLPNFQIKTLNVSFRSAHHISTFSTNFIHKSKDFTRTSVRIPGCLTSKQTKIALQKISSAADLVLNDENNTRLCYGSNRRALVFSDKPEVWKERFESEPLVKLTIVSPRTNFTSAPYTGCEAWSVIIIVDDLPHEIHDKRTFGVLNLAITRAQYEVCIFAADSVYKRIENFLEENECYWENILIDAANHTQIDLSFLQPCSKWDKKTRDFVVKLFQISIMNSNTTLFEKLLDLYPGEDGKKHLPIQKIISAFDGQKTDAFVKVMSDRVGKQFIQLLTYSIMAEWIPFLDRLETVPKASDMAEASIIVGNYKSIVDWYFERLGSRIFKMFIKNWGRLLYAACYTGDPKAVEWALHIFDRLDLEDQKKKELSGLYPLLNRGDVTLLCLVSYCRCPRDVFRLLFQAGFPEKLLLQTCMGKNALHFALNYDDSDLVDVLLEKQTRKKILLESVIILNGRNASVKEFAEVCGYSNKHQF
ncbi:uncharacterized protein LOC134843983 isoform X4 [Symsagittifera roscoffensis]